MKLKDIALSAAVGYIIATAEFWVIGGWSRRLIIGLMAAVVFLAFLDWAERTWKRLKQVCRAVVIKIRQKRRIVCTRGK